MIDSVFLGRKEEFSQELLNHMDLVGQSTSSPMFRDGQGAWGCPSSSETRMKKRRGAFSINLNQRRVFIAIRRRETRQDGRPHVALNDLRHRGK
jgi:hypothetical protein